MDQPRKVGKKPNIRTRVVRPSRRSPVENIPRTPIELLPPPPRAVPKSVTWAVEYGSYLGVCGAIGVLVGTIGCAIVTVAGPSEPVELLVVLALIISSVTAPGLGAFLIKFSGGRRFATFLAQGEAASATLLEAEKTGEIIHQRSGPRASPHGYRPGTLSDQPAGIPITTARYVFHYPTTDGQVIQVEHHERRIHNRFTPNREEAVLYMAENPALHAFFRNFEVPVEINEDGTLQVRSLFRKFVAPLIGGLAWCGLFVQAAALLFAIFAFLTTV